MAKTSSVDAARVELLLTELRLPAMKALWRNIAGQSDKEGWPAARFLAALLEHEMADRGRRRIAAISPKPICPPEDPRHLRLRGRCR